MLDAHDRNELCSAFDGIVQNYVPFLYPAMSTERIRGNAKHPIGKQGSGCQELDQRQ